MSRTQPTLPFDVLHTLFDLIYLESDLTNIKYASLVSRVWRSAAIPFLFRNVNITGNPFPAQLSPSLSRFARLLDTDPTIGTYVRSIRFECYCPYSEGPLSYPSNQHRYPWIFNVPSSLNHVALFSLRSLTFKNLINFYDYVDCGFFDSLKQSFPNLQSLTLDTCWLTYKALNRFAFTFSFTLESFVIHHFWVDDDKAHWRSDKIDDPTSDWDSVLFHSIGTIIPSSLPNHLAPPPLLPQLKVFKFQSQVGTGPSMSAFLNWLMASDIGGGLEEISIEIDCENPNDRKSAREFLERSTSMTRLELSLRGFHSASLRVFGSTHTNLRHLSLQHLSYEAEAAIDLALTLLSQIDPSNVISTVTITLVSLERIEGYTSLESLMSRIDDLLSSAQRFPCMTKVSFLHPPRDPFINDNADKYGTLRRWEEECIASFDLLHGLLERGMLHVGTTNPR